MPGRRQVWVIVCLLAGTTLAAADEKLAGRACRSVHLFYPAPEGTAFHNEIRVTTSAPGTYFMVCGWSHGYFGMQELGNGKKVLLFSVWDPTKGDDPKAVPEAQRVKLLHRDPAVRVGRFGNEGTGGQAFLDFDWQVDKPYRFLVTAQTDGDRTGYSGYFFHPQDKAWRHLVTFSTLAKGEKLRGYYSFVEDFRRNGTSAMQPRRAAFGNGWVRTNAGEWKALLQARFSADSNPATNINAGNSEAGFYLATGGTTPDGSKKLRTVFDLKPARKPEPPGDLPVP